MQNKRKMGRENCTTRIETSLCRVAGRKGPKSGKQFTLLILKEKNREKDVDEINLKKERNISMIQD